MHEEKREAERKDRVACVLHVFQNNITFFFSIYLNKSRGGPLLTLSEVNDKICMYLYEIPEINQII